MFSQYVAVGMRERGAAGERLRAFVRRHARPDGDAYERGNAIKLARHLGKSPAWVTQYTDDPPEAHATIDEAIAICEFYGLTLNDLAKGALRRPRATTPAADPLESGLGEVVRHWKGKRQELEAFVNSLRMTVGLPALELKRGRTHAKTG